MDFKPVARIHSVFPTKFGVPRQSGLAAELDSLLVFEPEFRNPDAFRGLEGFSHVWLIWVFHQAVRESWSPTVRPPRLGGNTRLGVFATRSPFRPNPIGLSAAALAGVEHSPEFGPCLRLRGTDLVDGTPVLDVKPYIPYADAIPDAKGGFAAAPPLEERLAVDFPLALLEKVPPELREGLRSVLALDPRPRYQNDPKRVYGFGFAGLEVRFSVDGNTLTVRDVLP